MKRLILMVCLFTFVVGSQGSAEQVYPPKKKNPWTAFGCSFFLPGGGQLYNGQIGQASLHLGILLGASVMVYAALEDDRVYSTDILFGVDDPDEDDDLLWLGWVIGGANWLVSVISAPISARRINKRNEQSRAASLIRDRLMLEPYVSHGARGAVLSLRF